MPVSQLGYLGFRVSDPARWSNFLTEGLGLMEAEGCNGERRYRNDALSWRISLEEGAEDDVAFIGFEAEDQSAFFALRDRITEAGTAVLDNDHNLSRLRNVLDVFACHDPDGRRIEVFYGPGEDDSRPFVSPAGVTKFLTGTQGLGHILLTSGNMELTRTFYRDVLGLRLSDIISLDTGGDRPLDLEFYHCNHRHHTLAFLPLKGPKHLQHFMLQVSSLDEVGFAYDRMETVGAPISLGLGRHSNDKMISFYAQTPSGFDVEFGFGAIEVDEATWRITKHNRTSAWGHKTPGPVAESWQPPQD